MKYRIKKMEYKNGEIQYIPQYKFLFIWFDCSEYNHSSDAEYPVIFNNYENAKTYLINNKCNKIIMVEYLNTDC